MMLVLFCSKRFQSLTGQESFNMSGVSNDLSSTSYSDLEAVKQEILAEIRKEINQAKQDIIDGKFVRNSSVINPFTGQDVNRRIQPFLNGEYS